MWHGRTLVTWAYCWPLAMKITQRVPRLRPAQVSEPTLGSAHRLQSSAGRSYPCPPRGAWECGRPTGCRLASSAAEPAMPPPTQPCHSSSQPPLPSAAQGRSETARASFSQGPTVGSERLSVGLSGDPRRVVRLPPLLRQHAAVSRHPVGTGMTAPGSPLSRLHASA